MAHALHGLLRGLVFAFLWSGFRVNSHAIRTLATVIALACTAPLLAQAQTSSTPGTPSTTNTTTARAAALLASDTAAQNLEQRLRAARELVRQLHDPASTASASTRAAWTQQLRQQLNAAVATTAVLRGTLFTADAQGTGQTKAAQARQTFTERANALDKASKAWLKNPNIANLAELAAFFAQYEHIGARLSASHNQLPWGHLKRKPRNPSETQSPQKFQAQAQALGSAPAIMSANGLSTVAGLQFTTAPDPAQAPTDADLVTGAHTALTPALRAKAAELGNNPVAITNWVRNTIQFAPNAGATQNAQTTLDALRGNASDIASLHIALLRAAGIPARYQSGTIELPSAQAQNWLGGLQSPEAALELLQQGGIAARGIQAGGQLSAIRMEHTWVVAYVNWTPSRGAKDGGANLSPRQHVNPNAALNAWVPLDAAFKPNTYNTGTNLAEVVPLNAAALLGRARQGASCTAASASGLNTTALSSGYSDFSTQARNQLNALGADASVAHILGASAITPRQHALLAGTLPYVTVVTNTPGATLPSTANWTLQLSLFNGSAPVWSASRPLFDLQGQNLSLTFVPASTSDASTLATLLQPMPDGIPGYLVQLKAQLSLNGQIVMEGGSFTLGQSLTLRSQLQGPDGTPFTTDNTIVVGETHAWAVQGQALGASAPAAASATLTQLRSQLQTSTPPSGPEQTRQMLSALASTYQATLDAKARLYQSVAGVVEVRLPSLVRASTRLQADTVLGVVSTVRPTGIGLHVDHQGSASVSLSGSTTAYPQQSLERASASAHQLLDRVFGPGGSPAQSALSGLATAALQGQTLLRADSTTLPSVLASLNPELQPAQRHPERSDQWPASPHQPEPG